MCRWGLVVLIILGCSAVAKEQSYSPPPPPGLCHAGDRPSIVSLMHILQGARERDRQ